MFSSVRVAWPRRVLNARCSFSERFSNIDKIGSLQGIRCLSCGSEPYCNSRMCYFWDVKLEYIAEGSQDCPLIRLYSFDQPAVLRLRKIVEALSNRSSVSMALHDERGVESVNSCKLILRSGTKDRGVLQTGPLAFECTLTPDTWSCVKELIDPFCESSSTGFQWLSDHGKISLLLSRSGHW